MRHAGISDTAYRTGGIEDVPIYQGTRCTMCGVDEQVAVRHLDGVLCLDCYRTAARATRERRRQLEAMLGTRASAKPTAVAGRRLARLCAIVDTASSPARERAEPRVVAGLAGGRATS